MFWRLGFAHTSPVEQLLESEDFTLQQLLEEEDVIQECKQLNKKLVDYLAAEEQVVAMINYVVDDPDESADDKQKYLYPYKASEVLAVELSPVHDTIFGNDDLLEKLFSFLEKDTPLNLHLAGFFSKVVASLLARRPQETLRVMESRETVPRLLQHIGASSILELLLKVVSEAQDSSTTERNWVTWLLDQDLVGKLVEKLDSSLEPEVHENTCAALVGLLSNQTHQVSWMSAASSRTAKFQKKILQPESVDEIIKRTFTGSPSMLEHGLTLLVEIVKHCVNPQPEFTAVSSGASMRAARAFGYEDDFDEPEQKLDEEEHDHAGSASGAVDEIVKGLEKVVEILKNPPQLPTITNQAGTLTPPLGSTRLKILEVLVSLITMDSPAVNRAFQELKVVPTCLDIFFSYDWHNLMHNLVKRMLEAILQASADGGEELRQSIFTEAKLLDRIINAYAVNDEWVKQPKRCGKGYMGHLRVLSTSIMRCANSNDFVKEQTQGQAWKDFIQAHQEIVADLNDKSFSRSMDGHGSALSNEDRHNDTHNRPSSAGTFAVEIPANCVMVEDVPDDDGPDMSGGMDDDDGFSRRLSDMNIVDKEPQARVYLNLALDSEGNAKAQVSITCLMA